jgi:glutathione S-transferase
MAPHPYSALATLIALAVLFWTMILVGRARTKYGIDAPAVSGNEQFERCFRVQMNTLEQIVLMLPALWLCALWVGEVWAGIGGLVWSVGRIIYALGYISAPQKRSFGFLLSFLPTVVMFVADGISIVTFLLS